MQLYTKGTDTKLKTHQPWEGRLNWSCVGRKAGLLRGGGRVGPLREKVWKEDKGKDRKELTRMRKSTMQQN